VSTIGVPNDRKQHLLALRDLSTVANADIQRRTIRAREQRGIRADLVGSCRRPVAIEAQHLVRLVQRIDNFPSQHEAYRVQPILERGNHTQVSATAAQRPEQILVFLRTGCEQFSIGGHDIGRQQVIEGKAKFPVEVSEAAAQGESRDAGAWYDSSGGGQPERLGLMIKIALGGPAFGARSPVLRIDDNAVHTGQIDYQTVVAHSIADYSVTAAADRDRHACITRETDGRNYIGHARAPRNEDGSTVNHAVENLACLLIMRVTARNQFAPQLRREFLDFGVIKHDLLLCTKCAGH
jgi:hypothetical protein